MQVHSTGHDTHLVILADELHGLPRHACHRWAAARRGRQRGNYARQAGALRSRLDLALCTRVGRAHARWRLPQCSQEDGLPRRHPARSRLRAAPHPCAAIQHMACSTRLPSRHPFMPAHSQRCPQQAHSPALPSSTRHVALSCSPVTPESLMWLDMAATLSAARALRTTKWAGMVGPVLEAQWQASACAWASRQASHVHPAHTAHRTVQHTANSTAQHSTAQHSAAQCIRT